MLLEVKVELLPDPEPALLLLLLTHTPDSAYNINLNTRCHLSFDHCSKENSRP